jgi:transmembrane sensor
MNRSADLPTRAIYEAAEWYARLRGEAASPALDQAWQAWLMADETHGRAWQRVEAVCGQFKRVPGQLSVPTLSALSSRRTVLRSLALFAVAGGSGLLAYRHGPWPEWRSDFRTATGERREVQLADGSLLMLNTRSAVDVAFDAGQRLIQLRAGEILISTRPDFQSPPRPFRVRTEHGEVLALGTRFSVRVEEGATTVTVLEKAVEAGPRLQPALRQRVEAGQQLRFGSMEAEPLRSADPAADSWVQGRLVAVDMPLERVLAELSRYRSGYLGCDPAVAELKVSGAFPLDDSEQALAALVASFPLRVERYTRYWIRVLPAA